MGEAPICDLSFYLRVGILKVLCCVAMDEE